MLIMDRLARPVNYPVAAGRLIRLTFQLTTGRILNRCTPMLVIRLSRTGRNKYPTYRIVAADSKRAATGKFVMILGHYNPHTKELVINKDETIKFLGNGAQPSNAVIKLLKQDKIDLPAWAALKTRNRPAKKVAQVEAPAVSASADEAPEAAAAETAEAPEAIAVVAEEQAETVADNASSVNQVETAAAEAAADAAAKVASDQPDTTPAK